MSDASGEKEARRAPPALPGFQHIRRFWDSREEAWIAQIMPGECYVTTQPEIVATVLGSCVSVCIRDVRKQLGGMNHFMLPEVPDGGRPQDALRYGSAAIERLINEILKLGGRRGHLEVKLFGGGHVISGMSDVGQRNIDFVRQYMIDEGMNVKSEDLGGEVARKVRYEATTGRVRLLQMPMTNANEVASTEATYKRQLQRGVRGNNVELF